MAITQLPDGRWMVYWRIKGSDNKLKRKYFGRGDGAELTARTYNDSLKLARYKDRKKHGSKLTQLSPAKKMKLCGTQDYYRLFEQMRAQDLGRRVEFEVHTKMGFIDVLYEDEIVEIKSVDVWHHGYGQLIAYGKTMPGKRLRLFLFGNLSVGKLRRIKIHCESAGINLTLCGDILNDQGSARKKKQARYSFQRNYRFSLHNRPALGSKRGVAIIFHDGGGGRSHHF